MSGGDQATLDWYSRAGAAYAGGASAEADSSHLECFAAVPPRGGVMLDFGCGSGWAADRPRRMGFSVSGLDAEARRHYGIQVTGGRFENLEDVGAHEGGWAGAGNERQHVCARRG